ncbi:MAG: hypothetical protein ABIH42_10960 [Planctomycetota bacterium]
MKKLIILAAVIFIAGCASEEKKYAPPPVHLTKAEEMSVDMHSLPEFTKAEKLRREGHAHIKTAYQASKRKVIMHHWDEAFLCYREASDLFFIIKIKYPQYAECADKELDLTYNFIEECVRERPVIIDREKPTFGQLSDEQLRRMEFLQERIRQYQNTRIR